MFTKQNSMKYGTCFSYFFVELRELGCEETTQQHSGHLACVLGLLTIVKVAQKVCHLQLARQIVVRILEKKNNTII